MTIPEGTPGTVVVRADELRRIICDLTRESGPCDCAKCVMARRRLRAAAWPRQDDGEPWPDPRVVDHA